MACVCVTDWQTDPETSRDLHLCTCPSCGLELDNSMEHSLVEPLFSRNDRLLRGRGEEVEKKKVGRGGGARKEG